MRNSKSVIKKVSLPSDKKCVIIRETMDEADFCEEKVSYCYTLGGELEFKISAYCVNSEFGDAYGVEIEYPDKKCLIDNCSDESKALEVFNSRVSFKDRIPRLGRGFRLLA